MTSSVSRQDEPNLALQLATRVGKMELSCPLGIRALSRKYNLSCFGVFIPYNKSFIDQACPVNNPYILQLCYVIFAACSHVYLYVYSFNAN